MHTGCLLEDVPPPYDEMATSRAGIHKYVLTEDKAMAIKPGKVVARQPLRPFLAMSC